MVRSGDIEARKIYLIVASTKGFQQKATERTARVSNAALQLRFRVPNVAEVVKTFEDSQYGSKLLTSSATKKMGWHGTLTTCPQQYDVRPVSSVSFC